MIIGHRNHRLLAQEAVAIVTALAACAQVAHAAVSSSSSASNESHCAAADHLVQQFTKLRMAAVAAVVGWRVSKLFKTTRGSNPFVRLMKAGWCFAEHEGLGMLLYFSISFALDSATIFLVPSVGSYCEADKLAALYTAALVTFLPNAVYALYLQETYWEKGRTCARVGFVVGAIVLTSISFYLRLKFVFDAGYISFVQQTMSGLSVTVRAALASSIPPMVDVIQSVILIGVTHMKRGSPANQELLLPLNVEEGEHRMHIGGGNPTILESPKNSQKKGSAKRFVQS